MTFPPRISIFYILLTFYGRSSLQLANKYANERLRNSNIRETLAFNKRCYKNKVIPKTLIQRPPIRTQRGWQVAQENALRYLKVFIQDGYKRLRESNSNIFRIKAELSNSLPDYLSGFLEETVDERQKKYRLNIKKRLINKYDQSV